MRICLRANRPQLVVAPTIYPSAVYRTSGAQTERDFRSPLEGRGAANIINAHRRQYGARARQSAHQYARITLAPTPNLRRGIGGSGANSIISNHDLVGIGQCHARDDSVKLITLAILTEDAVAPTISIPVRNRTRRLPTEFQIGYVGQRNGSG